MGSFSGKRTATGRWPISTIRLDRLLIPTYFQRGLLYALRGENEKAKADWREALSLHPRCGDARIALGLAAWQAGDNDTAVTEIATGLSYQNAEATVSAVGVQHLSYAYNSRGCGHMQKGELEAAKADLQECIRLYPDADLSHANLAKIYLDLGQYADAVRHIDVAGRINKHLTAEQQKELQEAKTWAEGKLRERGEPATPATPTPAPSVAADHAWTPRAGQFPTPGGVSQKGTLDRLAERLFTPDNLVLAAEVAFAVWNASQHQPPKVQVDGYWRNGVYVKPHERSRPRR